MIHCYFYPPPAITTATVTNVATAIHYFLSLSDNICRLLYTYHYQALVSGGKWQGSEEGRKLEWKAGRNQRRKGSKDKDKKNQRVTKTKKKR